MPVFELLPEDNIRQGFFEHAEFLALLDGTDDEDLKDFWTFGYYLGWRKGSIEALEWTDFDVNNLLLNVRAETTKERKANWIRLPEGPLEDLFVRRWTKRQFKRADGTTALSKYIFHRGDGKRFGDFEKAWATACKKAGLTKVLEAPDGTITEIPSKLLHDFRRTAYRNMRHAGVDKDVARAIVGHRTDSMARRYQILDSAEKELALEQVHRYLQGVHETQKEQQKRILRFKAVGK